MEQAKGIPVWPGIAKGKLNMYAAVPEQGRPRNCGEEEQRFLAAREQAVEEQRRLAERAEQEAGTEAAAIFSLHAAMLEDEEFSELVLAGIKADMSAEQAVRGAEDWLAGVFAGMDDPYLRERAADVRDVAGEVLAVLAGSGVLELEEDVILLAEELLPSQLLRLDRRRLRGLVTRTGGVNSHTAILARGMGLPMLVGCEGLDRAWEGRTAVLDGYAGRLYVDPAPEFAAELEARARGTRSAAEKKADDGPILTAEGRRIRVCANVGGLHDLEPARCAGAEGVGLFRTEFLCLERGVIPTEEEQYAVYRQALEAMAPHTVVVRTWDLGGDKAAELLERSGQLRGVQLCLAREDLFRPQLRALLRASIHGKLGILFPMIAHVSELRACKALLEDCRAQLEREGVPTAPVEVGAMIETPAAALCASELAKECDFFSIGTNDLTQYTCGVDRQRAGTGRPHPAVLRLMRMAVRAAKRRGLRVCVCGEMGADTTLTGKLLGMGVDELSVNPGSVALLREKAREAALKL